MCHDLSQVTGFYFGGVVMNFKKCSGCVQQWKTRDEFLSDPQVKLIGYQINFEALKAGFFMFNHMKPECLTTLALQTGLFSDLYRGEVYHERLSGTETCPGYCQHSGNLKACPVKCECGFVREVMQIILSWSKSQGA